MKRAISVTFSNLERLLVCPDTYNGTALALFAVDFDRICRRPSSSLAPGCGREAAFRGRPRLGSSEDQADRHRIREALGRLGETAAYGC